jgi:hypothetical protein
MRHLAWMQLSVDRDCNEACGPAGKECLEELRAILHTQYDPIVCCKAMDPVQRSSNPKDSICKLTIGELLPIGRDRRS